ncbi:MAG TPA: hypothetical protein VFG10_07365 [Saprospiraceae bacterium]|nr:hypothetical protein [Saprospiraceae bacterium]
MIPYYKRKFVVFTVAAMLCSCFATGQQVVSVDLKAHDLLYVPTMKKLLAVSYFSNEITKVYAIDEITGTKEVLLDFHIQISRMDVSADGSLLYLGLRHLDSSIIVVNLPSLTIENVFSVRPNQTLPIHTISRIKVSPQDPHLIAVMRDNPLVLDNYAEIVLYDHGVQRPNTIQNTSGAFYWAENKPVLYVSNGNEFSLLPFDDQGVYATDSLYRFPSGSTTLFFYNNRIYCPDRTVIDITQSRPAYFGRMALEVNFNDTWVDHDHNQIIQAYGNTDRIVLYMYDPVRLTPLGQPITVPAHGDTFGHYTSLGNGLDFAVLGEEDIMIVRFCENAPPAPVLDPKFDVPVILCLGSEINISPPSGYNYVIDQDGRYHDSLVITEQGTYTIRVANGNGCLSPASYPIKIQTASTPYKPSITVWNGTIFKYQATINRCDGGTTLFKGSSTNADWLEWSTGYIGDRLTTDQLGNIRVYGISDDGCKSEPSDIINVNAMALTTPEPPEIFSKDGANGCNNVDRVILLAEKGYAKYHWHTSDGTESSDTLKYVSPPTKKSISLRGLSAQGCWSEFSTIDVNFYDIDPAYPQIAVLYNYLSVNLSGHAYQWFLNGVPIPDSDVPVWKVFTPGDYQVRVFDGVCWSTLSSKKTMP